MSVEFGIFLQSSFPAGACFAQLLFPAVLSRMSCNIRPSPYLTWTTESISQWSPSICISSLQPIFHTDSWIIFLKHIFLFKEKRWGFFFIWLDSWYCKYGKCSTMHVCAFKDIHWFMVQPKERKKNILKLSMTMGKKSIFFQVIKDNMYPGYGTCR